MAKDFFLRKDDYKRFKQCFKVAWALANQNNLQQVVKWTEEKKISVFKIPLEYTASKINDDDFIEVSDEEENFSDNYQKFAAEINLINNKLNGDNKSQFFQSDFFSDIASEAILTPYVGETIADGLEVGQAAKEYFQRDYSYLDFSAYQLLLALKKTTEMLQLNQYQVFFEPAFQYRNCLTRCDILIKLADNTYHLIEVKASTGNKYNKKTGIFEEKSLNKKHQYDIAYQYYVLTGCGLKISKISLMYLNRDYIREGDIDYDQLFYFRTMYNHKKSISLLEYAQAMNQEGENYQKILQGTENFIFDDLKTLEKLMLLPVLDILQCFKSSSCYNHKPDSSKYYYGYCQHVSKFLPEHHNVFELSGNPKYFNRPLLLYEEHFDSLLQINSNFTFTNSKYNFSIKQQRQINVVNNRDSVIASNKINYLQETLNKYQYPIYMYDFETMKAALPPFDYSFSYQQIPFQYSVHIILDDKYSYHHPETMPHYDYLSDGNEDPRLELIKHLVTDLFSYGQGIYVAYYQSFEKSRLQELIDYLLILIDNSLDLQQKKQYYYYIEKLKIILDCTIDLMDFFVEFAIYLPNFYGSVSIKKTLPAFDQKFSYQDLKIRKGDMASETFRRRAENNISYQIWLDYFRDPMLQYCNRDTLAMVVILEHVTKLLQERKKNEKI